MVKTIYLTRHCDYSNPRNILPGRLPVPLSDNGRQQAQRLSDYFQDKQINGIYSSAVLRCQQTAEAIAQNKTHIVYDQRLLETHSAYQGYWFDHNDLDWSHFFSHRHELGGESYADIQNRAVSVFNELVQSDHQNIVVCSHGDPLYLLYFYLKHQKVPSENEDFATSPDYQPKASVRPIIVEHGQYTSKDVLTF